MSVGFHKSLNPVIYTCTINFVPLDVVDFVNDLGVIFNYNLIISWHTDDSVIQALKTLGIKHSTRFIQVGP